MSRWEPDARGRLLDAALELFAEQGYEATTAAQIAARAGLTKTTLFRLFADKREILFHGQPRLIAVATAGVQAAARDATGPELLHAGLRALCDAHVIEQQEIGRQITALVASSPDLQERAAFKRTTIATALATAMGARLSDRRLAGVLADVGVRAYYDGFDQWINTRREDRLSEVVFEELAALENALSRHLLAEAGSSSAPSRASPGGPTA